MTTTRKTSPFEGYEELASFGKENVEAMVRSAAVDKFSRSIAV